MAKGEDKKVQALIDRQRRLGEERDAYLWNQYDVASQRQFRDYENLMSQYGEIARTGGYSPEDLQNIRARSVSPIRSIYAGANREVDRSRALQGGYSPNYAAAKAKMAREMSSSLADANTNVEANIAEMVQRGKLAGLAGMGNVYGTSPGQAGLFGSMYDRSANRQMDLISAQLANRRRGLPWGRIFGGIGTGARYLLGGGGGATLPQGQDAYYTYYGVDESPISNK
jgi:hypothetical protein